MAHGCLARADERFVHLSAAMAKYHVTIADNDYEVEIDGEQVRIDGEPISASLHLLNESGLYLLDNEERKREMHIQPAGDSTFTVSASGQQIDARVSKAKGRKKNQSRQDEGEINAPIPGVVVKVLVQEGDSVQEKQQLVVIESMKMLMEFQASFTGRVAGMHVKVGDHVEKGDLMVRLERV